MNAINSPIPPAIACFKLSGIATISFCLNEVKDNKRKMIPVTNTAENAMTYVIPLPVEQQNKQNMHSFP